MNWYPRFPGDYMRDTAHLTLAEHGAYNVLLDHYYSSGGPLPADVTALIRICRAYEDHEKQAVEAVANAFFPVNGDGKRHNARADRQLEEMRKKHAVLSDAGKRAMALRWGKGGNEMDNKQATSQDNSQAITYPHPQPHPHTRSQKPQEEDSSESARKPRRSKPSTVPVYPADEVLAMIPITGSDHDSYPITHDQADRWAQDFPAVDVPATLREIRAWNEANPRRRKTASGVCRHVVAWLTREQNGGR